MDVDEEVVAEELENKKKSGGAGFTTSSMLRAAASRRTTIINPVLDKSWEQSVRYAPPNNSVVVANTIMVNGEERNFAGMYRSNLDPR